MQSHRNVPQLLCEVCTISTDAALFTHEHTHPTRPHSLTHYLLTVERLIYICWLTYHSRTDCSFECCDLPACYGFAAPYPLVCCSVPACLQHHVPSCVVLSLRVCGSQKCRCENDGRIEAALRLTSDGAEGCSATRHRPGCIGERPF